MTSESTRFLGQPRETKPTEGAAGGELLVTVLLYVGRGSWVVNRESWLAVFAIE
jgi:hypothetical protein